MIASEPLVGMAEPSTRAKWRALRRARSSTLKKCLTGIHIVRDAMLRQPPRTERLAEFTRPHMLAIPAWILPPRDLEKLADRSESLQYNSAAKVRKGTLHGVLESTLVGGRAIANRQHRQTGKGGRTPD